jgi:NAD-dependent aldehyde dehydrogenases
LIATGVDEDAELLFDNRDININEHEDGSFLDPTVFGDIGPDMTIARKEIFGPVLGLLHGGS